MIELREATAGDRDAILSLRARCFGDDDPEKHDPRFWEWEFRGARMFVADAGGRVVGHLGFIPQTHVIRGEPRTGMLAVDAMTDPEFRGQQLFSRVARFAAEHLARDAAFSTAWQIRRAVLGGVMSAGWARVGGARVLVRPILFSRRPSTAHRPPDPAVMASIAREMFASSEAYVDRTAEHLRWRYFDSPLWHYDVAMTDDAWIVTRRTTLKGIATLAVVDVAWRRGRARDARHLLGAAMRASDATLAATLVTPAHPAFWWFLRGGFLPGPHRFRLLLHDFSLGHAPRFALAWGDTDHL